jgi:hypothetical protein
MGGRCRVDILSWWLAVIKLRFFSGDPERNEIWEELGRWTAVEVIFRIWSECNVVLTYGIRIPFPTFTYCLSTSGSHIVIAKIYNNYSGYIFGNSMKRDCECHRSSQRFVNDCPNNKVGMYSVGHRNGCQYQNHGTCNKLTSPVANLHVRTAVLTKSSPCYEAGPSHVVCNACNARIQRILHRICHSNVAHMKRASSVPHPSNIRTTSAWHSRVITAFDTRFMTLLLRVCRPFMSLQMSRTSSA